MCTYQKQEKSKLLNKKLRSFAVIFSLLEIASSFAYAGTKCVREDLGFAPDLDRIMHRKARISDDSKTLIKAKMLGTDSLLEKGRFSVTRLLQEENNENVLEIQNDNSKTLTITLLDQDSKFVTELGIVNARSTTRFFLDRNALYDSYSVTGYIGFMRNDTCANLSYTKFYSKIVFQPRAIGTAAQLERTADIY